MNLTQRLRDYGTVDPDRYGHGDTGEKKAMRAAADEIERLTAERDEAREHAEWQRERWREHIGRFDVTSRNQPFPWEQS